MQDFFPEEHIDWFPPDGTIKADELASLLGVEQSFVLALVVGQPVARNGGQRVVPGRDATIPCVGDVEFRPGVRQGNAFLCALPELIVRTEKHL